MVRESMLSKRKEKEKNKAVATTLNAFTGKNNTDNMQYNDTKFVTKNDIDINTNNKTKNAKNNIHEYANIDVKQTRTIKIGSISIKSTATKEEMDNVKRAAYHLRLDTIEKIQKCAKLSGLKKAELVDIILNNELTNILDKTGNE